MFNASKRSPWQFTSRWLNSSATVRPILNVYELAAYLQIPSDEIFHLIEHEGLPVIYLIDKDYVRFLQQSVDEWLRNQEIRCATRMDAFRTDEDGYYEHSQPLQQPEEDESPKEPTATGPIHGHGLKIFRGDD
jgi:hypothetical protein